MPSKDDLIHKILSELRRAQIERWSPPPPGKVRQILLPPSLPLSDGRQMSVTSGLLGAVSDYSKVILSNKPDLKSRFKNAELYQLVATSFGGALQTVDLDKSNMELSDKVKNDVDAKLHEMIERHREPIQLTLGCHLFDGEAAYPIAIGPVVFETREQWLSRAEYEGKLSAITARRLKATWDGRTLQKRKATYDSINERAMLDTVGQCLAVCTVSTDGLSSKMIKEKGLLAARLAMTAISLIWTRPSQGLSWMNLRYDGETFHRH